MKFVAHFFYIAIYRVVINFLIISGDLKHCIKQSTELAQLKRSNKTKKSNQLKAY